MHNFSDARDVAEPLSWETRLKIMIGIARALTYMHSSENQVIHRDVKTSKILLDKVVISYIRFWVMSKPL